MCTASVQRIRAAKDAAGRPPSIKPHPLTVGGAEDGGISLIFPASRNQHPSDLWFFIEVDVL